MKALVKARAEPGIWMQDVPEPAVGHNDVLIKVHRSAICGTDMHIYNWDAWAQKTVPVPMAVGHEYAGEIVQMGSEVRGFHTGDRVSGEGRYRTFRRAWSTSRPPLCARSARPCHISMAPFWPTRSRSRSRLIGESSRQFRVTSPRMLR